MVYLFIVNITLVICYALYHMLFKKLTFFQWNRVYLLGSVLLALLIPIGLFIDISQNRFIEQRIPRVDMSGLWNEPLVLASTENTSYYIADFLVPIYWGGVILGVLWLLYRVWRISKSLGREGENRPSFAFFNKIVLGDSSKEEVSILLHEQIHVQQGHSYDILLLELVRIFNWFNPLCSFYIKELKFQHECIADEACSEDRVAYAELLVCHAMKADNLQLSHEFSNQSFLKKRIMMLFKNKSQRKFKFLYLALAPVLLLMVFSTLAFNTSKAKWLVSDIENKVAVAQLPTLEGNQSQQRVIDQKSDDVDKMSAKQNLDQNTSKNSSLQDTTDKVLTTVEVSPEPIGGLIAFRKWISQNYISPQIIVAKKLKGRIVVSFVVERNGTLSNFKLIEDMGYGTGEEAIRLLKTAKMWHSGVQNGRKVRVAYTLPINLDFSDTKVIKTDKVVITSVNDSSMKNPMPKMGMAEFRKWIGDNYNFPQKAIDAGIKGRLVVSFIVATDGKLSDFKVVKDLGYGTGEEAIEVLKKAEPWIPATKDGKAVRVAFTMPITINLES